MKKIIIVAALVCIQLIFGPQCIVAQSSSELAQTPPMGWNSWNWFGKQKINETIVRQVIDSIASTGLKSAGYEYVVVDGGWRDTTLGRGGKLRANPKRFPHGIKPLADYAHSKGLKFGLHTVPGTTDCAGDPVGGFDHEKVQVRQFADWGIDFIKLDQCRYKAGWTKKLVKKTYLKWKRLLDESGRNIFLSVHVPIFDAMPSWIPNDFSMARLTKDIKAKVHQGGAIFDQHLHSVPLSVMRMAVVNNQYAPYSGNSFWNNPDMMVTGDQGLSIAEQKAHFALWSIMSAPLILGNDPRHMSTKEKEILTNEDAIAVNQDPTEQGTRIKVRGDREIWAKQLKDGRQAVLMINRSKDESKDITLPFIRLGMRGEVQLKDIYGKKDLGTFAGSFTKKIPPQSSLFFLAKRIRN